MDHGYEWLKITARILKADSNNQWKMVMFRDVLTEILTLSVSLFGRTKYETSAI